jgi:hypothetical protein
MSLMAVLADRGLHVSPYQLERWRTVGLLPRNRRRGLGRGKGSASEPDDEAVARAEALARWARQGRALPGGHIIERFARGQQLDEARVRAAFSIQLDRVSRKLAVGAGDGDKGWQARHDAARRTARDATSVNWQEFIDAINEVPERPRPTPARERAAARTFFHTLADGTETTAEEFLHAFDAYRSQGVQDVGQLIQDQRKAELAGTFDWDTVAYAMNIVRYREVLDASSIDDLQRSAIAIYTAWALQGMIAMMGTWPAAASRTGRIQEVPPSLRHVGPAAVAAMTADPIWQQWGIYQPVLKPRGMALPITMITLATLRLPDMLTNIEAYRDRLAASPPPQPAAPAAGPSRSGGPEPPSARCSVASDSPAAADSRRRTTVATCNSAPTLSIAPEPGAWLETISG